MTHPSRDSGYTLVEVLVVMSLMGIVMAIAVSGWSSWAQSRAHSGAASEIQGVMRQAQQRAITEGLASCVLFDTSADTYTVYRGRCTDTTKVKVSGPFSTSGVSIVDPAFTSTAGTSTVGASFYGRGTGSPGSVEITREGSTKVYRVSVEGLTGRVSVS